MTKPSGDAVLSALRSYDRIRNDLPVLRAIVLALGWSVDLRNVNELARTADVSRNTVYKDLRSRGIDPKRRDDPADPAYPALSGRMLEDLALLVWAYARALEQSDATPAGDLEFAQLVAGVLLSVGRLAETSPEVVTDDDWERDDSRAWRLVDILDNLDELASITCSALAEHTSDTQAAETFARSRLDAQHEAYVEAAAFRLSLPGGRIVNVEIARDEGELLTISDDESDESTPADRREHLALVSGFRWIADALMPRFASRTPGAPIPDLTADRRSGSRSRNLA